MRGRVGLVWRATVRETLRRAEKAGLTWPLPEDLGDEALEAALYAERRSKQGHRRLEEPDWTAVHRELKRKHVTLLVLRDEYIAANPGGYSYSRYCELYRALEQTLSAHASRDKPGFLLIWERASRAKASAASETRAHADPVCHPRQRSDSLTPPHLSADNLR